MDSKRIVVGVDRSEEARAAARYAAHLAEGSGLEILLAHAYEGWPEGTGDHAIEEFRKGSEESAQRLVDRVAAELRETTSATVETMIAAERPTRLLGRLAEQARLVVVGQDTAGLFERLAFGAVATHLAAHAPCPVVIVPAGWHPRHSGYHPVVVALSGEDLAPDTMAVAFEEAERSGTSVLALHAAPYFASPEELSERERDLGEIVAEAQRRRPTVPVQTLVVRGAPDEHLVRQSVNASAAVVGRPHGQGLTTWMRSVAHAVVKRTRCPLIIVPTTQ